jgi:hypothetical protein
MEQSGMRNPQSNGNMQEMRENRNKFRQIKVKNELYEVKINEFVCVIPDSHIFKYDEKVFPDFL